MNIKFLYCKGCPNVEATFKLLEMVLYEYKIDGEVHLVKVESDKMVREWRFLGSPTIRVDGKDIESGNIQKDFKVCCRI